jgi:hypothetical protein
MESTTYSYSKFVGWTGMLLFGGMLLFILYVISFMGVPFNDIGVVLSFTALILMLSGILFAFLKWCFLPMINGAITLELDEEKVQCYITRRTIYWKDVIELSEDYGRNYSGIIFKMVDGSDDLSIPTRWIEGGTTSIYNKMNEYFAKTL